MSLLFTDGGSERVIHPNTGTDPTSATLYFWVYPTATTASRSIFRKISVALAGGWSFATAASAGLRTTVNYSTTNADSRTTSGLVINTWQFIATTFDGVAAPKIYVGSLTAALAELSYNVSNAASGSRVTESGAQIVVGNIESPATSFSAGFPGHIAVMNWIPGVVLTEGQLKSHQFMPRVHPSTKIFSQYGFNGTSTQPDWSGNGNAGTVAGATQSAHVPLASPFGFAVPSPYIVPAASFNPAWARGANRIIGGGLYV